MYTDLNAATGLQFKSMNIFKQNILGAEYNKFSYLLIHVLTILPCFNETVR